MHKIIKEVKNVTDTKDLLLCEKFNKVFVILCSDRKSLVLPA